MMHTAKKSLGQNFLKSKPALIKMCTAGEVTDGDLVIEIGPGKGALTEKLLEYGATVIALEKDRDLIPLLNEKFAEEIQNKKLTIIEEDCLEFDPKSLKGKKYKLIANIPYYITGAIVRKFLETDHQPEKIVVMVQKEVAKRIVATNEGESILSISVKAYGEPKYEMKVDKRYFSPAPKVDSAILSINNINKQSFKNQNEEGYFFKVLHAGFAHKRKVLIKNLEEVAPKNIIEQSFNTLTLSPKVRAEEIPVSTWLTLTELLQKN